MRAYKDKDLEEDKLKKALEAARLSPSASNRQERKFVAEPKGRGMSLPVLTEDEGSKHHIDFGNSR